MDSILIAGGAFDSRSRSQVYDESEALLTGDCSLPDLPKQVVEIIISMYQGGATKQNRETESVFFFDKAHASHFFKAA